MRRPPWRAVVRHPVRSVFSDEDASEVPQRGERSVARARDRMLAGRPFSGSLARLPRYSLPSAMATYVMSMLRVSKIVPPKRQIIKDISLSFFHGAKIVLLGLNGSGKSTVLRIMGGVDEEYDGQMQRKGGLRIGYLPQEPSLDGARTVREEVESALGEVAEAQRKLEAVYAAYSEPDADMEKLAEEQARLEAMLAS